jgi:phosphate transport system substrate-binding protein
MLGLVLVVLLLTGCGGASTEPATPSADISTVSSRGRIAGAHWYVQEVTKGEIVPEEGPHHHFQVAGKPVSLVVTNDQFLLSFDLPDGRKRVVTFVVQPQGEATIVVSCPISNVEPDADALSWEDRRLNEAITDHTPVPILLNRWTTFFNDRLNGVFSSDWQVWWGDRPPEDDQLATSATPSPTHIPTVAPAVISAPEIEAAPTLIALDYPNVDGSTSAHPLQVLLACRIFGVPCAWQESWALDTTRRFAPDLGFEESPQLVERINSIRHSGTHGAYVNLVEGNADFILVARPPSKDELQAAQERGVVLDVQAVALDAFVFLVNAENPVDDLALETIRDIYTGESTHWSELEASEEQDGRVGEEIHTYQRNRNSGSQELMETLVMQGTTMMDSPEMMLESMMGPINAIGEDPLGIGYSVYYYVVFIFPSEYVKLTGVDGVAPTSNSIAHGNYPLTTEVYAVIREGMPQESSALLLRDWLHTAEGQAVVKESGYVPIRQ